MLQPTPQQPPQQTQPKDLPAQTPMEGEGELPVLGADQEADEGTIIQNLEAHLDQLPDQDKAFLAEHLTPEFVRAIGLINGPEVAQYLNQFADPNKVLVPVPREVAEREMKAQQGAAPQGQPMPQTPQGQPPQQGAPQGVMAPQQQQAATSSGPRI